ncbi:MAG: alanine racemase [Arachnia sp.]
MPHDAPARESSPCTLHVDLDALRHNVTYAKSRAGGRGILVAVKANAYGHGLIEVARSLAGMADWLGVALVSEAQQLRAAGIATPILKFTHTFAEELPAAIEAGLSLTVADADAIGLASLAAQRAGAQLRVHLKLDTGMRRLGGEPSDAVALATQIAHAPGLVLDGLMTHLAISDAPAGAGYTRDQLEAFQRAVERVVEAVGPIRHIHAANSGGLLNHDVSATTMVRPGIMIYGNPPDSAYPDPELRPVLRWTSRVGFVKPILAGQSVGYGRTWTASRDTWIATVSVGYGDGYSRLLSNRGRMLIDGRAYPIVGRVCMDQTMIDLGPERPAVRVGDEVVLVGDSGPERISVDDIAALMGTISYEVTCLISQRVPRVYSDR